MGIETLRSILTVGICLVLAQAARAGNGAETNDDGTQAVAQLSARDSEGPSSPSNNNGQSTGGASQAAESRPADDCTGPSKDCVAVGHWNFDVSLGAGVRTDPVVHEADIPLVVIPHFSYYGKRPDA